MSDFIYDGVRSKEKKIMVLKVHDSILPEIQSRVTALPGRNGVIYNNYRLGIREIKIDIAFICSNRKELRTIIFEAAAWLDPEKGLRQLILPEIQDKAINAVLSGTTEFERIAYIGKGTLTFLCPDPLFYGINGQNNLYSDIASGTKLILNNPGTYPEAPVITIRNNAPLPENLCSNPCFETDTSSWTFQATGASSGSLTRDTVEKFAGAASGRLQKNNTTSDISRCYFSLTGYQAGHRYPFRAKIKSQISNGLTVYAEEETTDWQYPQVSETMYSGNAGSWNEITGTIIPIDSGGSVFIFFEARETQSYASWIDEVELLSDNPNVVIRPGLQLGSKFLQYNKNLNPGDELILDLDRWTAKVNGINVLNDIEGDFYELDHGDNSLTFLADSGVAEIGTTIYGRWL